MAWGLIGQEAPVKTLGAMIAAGRLPHALLFTGPAGGGKNTLARRLAAALNCQSPAEDGGPCDQCPDCLKIVRDVHPDVTTLAPAGRARIIKMEDVQALRSAMAFRPYEGRAKVFIVREADRLSADSGNALLKTLEEPPPDSVLILTSASEAEVTATILSRCLRLRLPPLPREVVMASLDQQRGLTGPPARLLAALAGGALGPALSLDPEATWERWLELNRILGAESAPERLTGAWQWTKTAAGEEDRTLTLSLLRLWWRETARLAAAGPDRLEGPPPDRAQFHWAGRLDPRALVRLHQALNRLEDSLARFVKPELAYENFWLSVFSP